MEIFEKFKQFKNLKKIKNLKELFSRIHEFFSSPTHSRTFILLGILLLILALPVTVIFLQQRTQTQQHASTTTCQTRGGVCTPFGICRGNCDVCDGTLGCGGGQTCCDPHPVCSVSDSWACGPYTSFCDTHTNSDCTKKTTCTAACGKCGYNGSTATRTGSFCNGTQSCTSESYNTCTNAVISYSSCSNAPGKCGYTTPSCPGGVPSGSFCVALGICRGEAPEYEAGASCGGGLVCCEPVPTPKPTATPAPNPNDCESPNHTGGVGFCEKYQCANGEVTMSGSCTAPDSVCCKAGTPTYTCGINGSGNDVFVGTDGSVTYCKSGTACRIGTTWSTNGGVNDAQTHLCLSSTTSSCYTSGGSCEKYQCANGEVTMSGSCTFADSVCCKAGVPTYKCDIGGNTAAFDGTDGSVTYCDSGKFCKAGATYTPDTSSDDASNENYIADAKANLCTTTNPYTACVNFEGALPWQSCSDNAKTFVPNCPNPQNYVKGPGYCSPAYPIIPCGPANWCIYKGPITAPTPQPWKCGSSGTNSYCTPGVYNSKGELSCPTGQLGTGDYIGCGTYDLCCVNSNSLTPIPPAPTKSSETQCSNAGGQCYFNLSGCPGSLPKNLGKMDCNAPTFCCATSNSGVTPPPGCTGNCPIGNPSATPPTPPSCQDGQTTGFVLSVKLDGIGANGVDNNAPAHTTRQPIYINVVDESNNVVYNDTKTQLTYSNGMFTSPSISLGTTLTCGHTYSVVVKVPRYLPAKATLAYGSNGTINLNPITGDINKVRLSDKAIVGDDQITINDYAIVRACHNVDPTTPQTFTDNTNTVTVTCGDLMNFIDYSDGGTQGDEWSYNYNAWVRGYVAANGY